MDYIPKPLAGEEVIARVSTHLRLKQAYESLAELQAERIRRLASAQVTMMPQPSSLPEARFSVSLQQVSQAGGDFYDVIPVGGRVVDYLVADASGHDLAASFWTASLKTLLNEYATPINPPRDVLCSINSAMCRILPSGVYFTVLCARLNRQTNRLTLVTLSDTAQVKPIGECGDLAVIVSSVHGREVGLLGAMPVDVVETKAAGRMGRPTGMGSDGTLGLRLLRRHGCFTIAQDEASCVVYGMPKAAVEAGVIDVVLPLDALAAQIVAAVRGGLP